MNDEKRTRTRYVPPAPTQPDPPHPSTIDSTEEAKKSPAFRKALQQEQEREAQSDFSPDRNIWDRTGAGPDVPKTDPEESQKREGERAQRERGY